LVFPRVIGRLADIVHGQRDVDMILVDLNELLSILTINLEANWAGFSLPPASPHPRESNMRALPFRRDTSIPKRLR
jgi:hypothetical protein